MKNRHEDYKIMLELINAPAFVVCGETIVKANSLANALMIYDDAPIAPLLGKHYEQFMAFRASSMRLELQLEPFTRRATITSLSDGYLFTLDSENVTAELKAMSAMSNQLSTSLTGLIAYAQRNKETMDTDLYREVCRINRMLNNIKNARLYAEEDDTFHHERNICSVVEEILEECAALLKEAGIPLRYELPAKAVYTLCDGEMLRQALYNLIDNAALHTPAGEGIEVTLSKSNNVVCITVADHGKGVSTTIRPHMYTTYASELKPEHGATGLGLGLTVVEAVAKAHGGSLFICKDVENGTKVTMSLPIKSANGKTLRTPAVTIISSPNDGTVMLSNVLPAKLYKID